MALNLFGTDNAPGFGSSTVSSLGGAAGDIFSGISTDTSDQIKAAGDQAEGYMYSEAAKQAELNAQITAESTAVGEAQKQREMEMNLGGTQAAAAGGNLSGGSEGDIMRASAQQGALASQVLQRQGVITEQGYKIQAQADTAMSNAAYNTANAESASGKNAEIYGSITGGIKTLAAVATL
jgi:hypothetical protein